MSQNGLHEWGTQEYRERTGLPKKYQFPFDEYEIIGDKSEIERMCKVEDKKFYIEHYFIEESMSKTSFNYVGIGYSDREDKKVFEAFYLALCDVVNVSKKIPTDIVCYIWFGDPEFRLSEIDNTIDYISTNLTKVYVIWGIGMDLSLGKAIKVSMIATCK